MTVACSVPRRIHYEALSSWLVEYHWIRKALDSSQAERLAANHSLSAQSCCSQSGTSITNATTTRTNCGDHYISPTWSTSSTHSKTVRAGRFNIEQTEEWGMLQTAYNKICYNKCTFPGAQGCDCRKTILTALLNETNKLMYYSGLVVTEELLYKVNRNKTTSKQELPKWKIGLERKIKSWCTDIGCIEHLKVQILKNSRTKNKPIKCYKLETKTDSCYRTN